MLGNGALMVILHVNARYATNVILKRYFIIGHFSAYGTVSGRNQILYLVAHTCIY